MPYTLLIQVHLPALGYASFAVKPYFKHDEPSAPVDTLTREMKQEESAPEAPVVISNSLLTLTFDSTTGLLTTMTNLVC